MYREEVSRFFSWGAHHRRLLARLAMVLSLTALVDLFGTVVIYFAERHAAGTKITSVGDALFFTTVQLLTVSSQLPNPFTVIGRITDVVLENPAERTFKVIRKPADGLAYAAALAEKYGTPRRLGVTSGVWAVGR